MAQDNSVDKTIKSNPADYLAPVSGDVPHLLLIGVYLIALLLIIIILKPTQHA